MKNGEEFGDLERQHKLDFGFVASMRDAIEWRLWEEEQTNEEKRKKAKIIINGKEVENDKVRTNTRKIL